MSDGRADLVARFAALFEGRKDAVGLDHGECQRQPEGVGWDWWQMFREHLDGTHPIGVYPIVVLKDALKRFDGPHVKWGCSDIDVDDLQAAINLRNALKALDITSWIEVSKSKGYHVWVFAQQWVPAATMRRALLAAHDIADVPATEVNPKQEKLEEGQIGNYVRLPYPGGLNETPLRRVVRSAHGDAYPLPEFVRGAEHYRTPLSVLQNAASLYVPHVQAGPIRLDLRPPSIYGGLVSKLNGLAYTIFTDGPLDGKDRSGTLFKLAVNAFDSGLSPNEVYAVLEDADARWGKFAGRKDGPQQLERIVTRAMSA